MLRRLSLGRAGRALLVLAVAFAVGSLLARLLAGDRAAQLPNAGAADAQVVATDWYDRGAGDGLLAGVLGGLAGAWAGGLVRRRLRPARAVEVALPSYVGAGR